MRVFSFRPALTLRGREFHGLRGFAGKPSHPPLTTIPVAGYVLAAVFDLVSRIGSEQVWSYDFYRAASFTLIAGGAASVLAATTGFLDWLRTTEKGNQVRRTVNAHAWTMVIVTLLVGANIALRVLVYWDNAFTPLPVVVLTAAAAGLTLVGSGIGGSLVYDYGFNVSTAGDSPAWHPSEEDVFPGQAEASSDESEQVRREG